MPLAAVHASVRLLAALALARAARLAWARAPPGEGALAARMLAAWWASASALVALDGAREALSTAGVAPTALDATILHLAALPLSVGLCGLLHHVAYLATGARRALLPAAAAGAALFAFATFALASPPPWRVLLAAAYGGTVALAAAAYARVALAAPDPMQRYRARGVTLATLLLAAVAVADLLVAAPPLARASAALASGVLLLAAYRPPSWVRRRLATA